jgi:hypothetical protein
MKKPFLVVVLMVAYCLLANAYAQDLYYTNEGYAACVTEGQLDNFTSFAVQKDKEAMAKLIISGQCVVLRGGIPVYRESLGFKSGFSGKIKIRPKGETASFWTVTEAVTKK